MTILLFTLFGKCHDHTLILTYILPLYKGVTPKNHLKIFKLLSLKRFRQGRGEHHPSSRKRLEENFCRASHKGRPLLQVAPLEKSVHRTLFSIHPCRAPPWAGGFALCGGRPGAPPLGSLRAFEKARPKLLIPWRMIITLLCNEHFISFPRFTQCHEMKSIVEAYPLPSGEGGEVLLVCAKS